MVYLGWWQNNLMVAKMASIVANIGRQKILMHYKYEHVKADDGYVGLADADKKKCWHNLANLREQQAMQGRARQ